MKMQKIRIESVQNKYHSIVDIGIQLASARPNRQYNQIVEHNRIIAIIWRFETMFFANDTHYFGPTSTVCGTKSFAFSQRPFTQRG
jgi:hypothetical protein